MELQTVNWTITGLGIFAEIMLLVVLILRRHYKSFPIFALYIAGSCITDVLVIVVVSAYSMQAGRLFYFASLPLQYLQELAVLFEIAWNVLRPVHSSLPKGLVRAFLLLICIAMFFGVFLAWHGHATGNLVDDFVHPLDLTIGLLRMLIFAVIAGFSQMLGIGLKNRVLQLATALSFYSAVDLMVTLGERHMGSANSLEPVRLGAGLLEMCFLTWAFTTKEVRRADFSPQMEQFLVTLAGRAKHARALVRMQVK